MLDVSKFFPRESVENGQKLRLPPSLLMLKDIHEYLYSKKLPTDELERKLTSSNPLRPVEFYSFFPRLAKLTTLSKAVLGRRISLKRNITTSLFFFVRRRTTAVPIFIRYTTKAVPRLLRCLR